MSVALLIGGGASTAAAQGIRLNDDIISDPQTAAAIHGFDPVAYFVENRAIAGKPAFQITYAGKVWYFTSESNRRAFATAPDAYLPAFGGHDPVAIAAGIPLAGSPSYFLISDQRVYLFRSSEARDSFETDPSIRLSAERSWPQVKRGLVP